MVKAQIDFAIITVIEIERRAVCRALQMTDEDRIRLQTRTYWRKRLPLKKKREFYEIVVAQSLGMGNVNVPLLVNEIIQHWEPQAILLVGIAGAASERQHLGDLVIASDVYYYERGKLTPDGMKPEPYMFKADNVLWDRVITVADWTAPISVPRPDETQERPKIYRGVIASGEKVIADAAVRDEIAAGQRRIKAIEMEGYGFSSAIWQSFDHIRHLVIKAICDRADSSKNDEWQPYAAAVAADFTKHFLLDRPLKPRNPPELEPNPKSGFDPRFSGIISAFKYGTIVPFLGSGINWCDHSSVSNNHISNQYSLCDIELAEQLAEKIKETLPLSNNQSNDIIETLLGVPCIACCLKKRPLNCPILDQCSDNVSNTEGVCKSPEACNSPIAIEQKLAIAKLDFRFLSQYFLLITNPNSLYQILNKLYKNSQPNPLHKFLADLPKKMSHLPYQLILTTNYDNLLEKAFEEARQPFDVVFYVAGGEHCNKFKHKRYLEQESEDLKQEDLGVIEDPLTYEEFKLRKRPVILKLFGSLEDNDCVITEDHKIDYLLNKIFENEVPKRLMSILQRNSLLFLGYSLNDYDLKLILNQSWEKRKLRGRSWLIHPLNPSFFDKKLWEGRNVEHIKSSLEYCLEQLEAGIKSEIIK